MFLNGPYLKDLLMNLSVDILLVKEWLIHNRLIINLSKTHAISFGNKKKNSSISLSLKFGEDIIEFVNETKLLVVVIDSKLKFISHINSICNKAN